MDGESGCPGDDDVRGDDGVRGAELRLGRHRGTLGRCARVQDRLLWILVPEARPGQVRRMGGGEERLGAARGQGQGWQHYSADGCSFDGVRVSGACRANEIGSGHGSCARSKGKNLLQYTFAS